MIRSFKDRETRRYFRGPRIVAVQGFANQAARRLTLQDSAETSATLLRCRQPVEGLGSLGRKGTDLA